MTDLDDLLADPRTRVRRLGEPPAEGRCVVYWMQRAQRGLDNPALNVAIEIGNRLRLPVAVHFGLHPRYPGANERHYAFLASGIADTARRCEARGVAFVFRPYPGHSLVAFCEEARAAFVVGDENPLREPERWRAEAARRLSVPFWTVDADVIVPSVHFEKEEYAARTLRPKLTRLLPRYLKPLGNPKAKVAWSRGTRPPSVPIPETGAEIAALLASLPLDRSAVPVPGAAGGTAAGLRALRRFTTRGLARYAADRNDPSLHGTSALSAFLHFGHLGPHTIALAARAAKAPRVARAAFLEELIVRRELAVNFALRNPAYDTFDSAPAWVRRTLAKHEDDPRPYLYDEPALEAGRTHDRLWNAAQAEMVATGRMHGWLRMYWAKKILEWTRSPREAHAIAVRLNDRYLLDGRDPNGYAGVAWAIAGKHDRPWAPERPVFGLVRTMSAAGAARKFDVDAAIARIERASGCAIVSHA